MRFLAHFAMRGMGQAVMVTTVTGLLSLILLPISYFSAATIALVTLRIGHLAGLKVVALATLATGILAQLVLGTPWVSLGFLLMMWLPVWWVAVVLRRSQSLGKAVLHAAIIGGGVVALFHLLIPDPLQWWQLILSDVFQLLLSGGGDEGLQQVSQMVEDVAPLMTGVLAMMMVFHLIGGLFVARWWQAVLYNPAGFGAEFRALQLGRRVAIGGTILLGLTLVTDHLLINSMLFVVVLLFGVQGVAVVHGLVRKLQAHRGWLIAHYLLLMMAPQALVALALVGLVDNWFDFRGSRPAPEGS